LTIRAYTHEEIDLLIQSIEWQEYQKNFTVNGYRHASTEPVVASFHDAGHILGSAAVRVKYTVRGNTTTVLFSGDLGRSHMPILCDPEPPPPVTCSF
jgi:metallo-beta-lactamase family protein